MLAFAILHVIGDPVLLLLPLNAGKEEYERYHKLLGLDKPVYVQYWKFASRAVQGDFGKSWYTDTPAFTLVLERMPPTLYLTSAGLVAALLIALPLGILAALKRHSLVDNLCTMLAVAGQAMPIFWLGIMLIIVFAVRLKALPASGYGTWQHFLMPAFTLGAFLAPLTMRLVRSGVIEIMNMDYIRPARAKGVGENTVADEPAALRAGPPRMSLRRLWRFKWGVAATAIILTIVGSAVWAPWISPWDPLSVDIRHRLGPPAWMDGGTRAHVLGTDQVGRDLLSRVIYGGRVSLIIGVAAVLVSSSIGVLLGLAAGYFAGRMDWTIMTLVNVMLTFPFVLLALAVIAVLGPSLVNMIIVLGIADWPLYARVIRAETLAIREREFIMAGRALGMSHPRIIFRQILPNLVSLIVVIATLQVARVIILESFLSFLGLGVQPPTPAWGNMLGEGRVYMLNSWWIAAFPGLAIFVTTLVINLIGNALRDWLDPHMKL